MTKRTSLSLLSAAALIGLTAAMIPASVPAEKSPSSTQHTTVPPENDFVVHEWGTFTTFSGSDGIFLEYRPLAAEHSDLPDFVLDRASRSQASIFAKQRLRGRVRMETPVTYFYTDQIRKVKARVDFPQGLLTEFYPPVQSMSPNFDASVAFKAGEPLGNSSLDWGEITLIPVDHLVPGIKDPQVRDQLSRHIASAALPQREGDHHYVQARATDAALVHVRAVGQPQWFASSAPKQDYLEKFLFYRGVGDFNLPLQAEFDAQGQLQIHNQGSLPLGAAILIRVDGEQISAAEIDRLAAGETKIFADTEQMNADQLAQLVSKSLVAEGLYEKEALAMVETWKRAWFTDPGTRVLSMLPGPITDELLPLHIEPKPKTSVRVLVGRLEIMTPAAEQQLLQVVNDSIRQRDQFTSLIPLGGDKPAPYPVPDAIGKLGRLAEPALVRAAKIAADAKIRAEAELLLAQLRGE